MKRLLAVILSVALILAVTGCTKAPEPERSVLKMLSGEITISVDEPLVAHYNCIADAFMARHPAVKLTFKPINSFYSYLNSPEPELNSEDGDVFLVSVAQFDRLLQNNYLMPFEGRNMLRRVGVPNSAEMGLFKAFWRNGGCYAMPFGIETMILYANNASPRCDELAHPLYVPDAPETVLMPFFDATYGAALCNAANLSLIKDNGKGGYTSDLACSWEQLTPNQRQVWTEMYAYWKSHVEKRAPLFIQGESQLYCNAIFLRAKEECLFPAKISDLHSNPTLNGIKQNLQFYAPTHVKVGNLPLKQWQEGYGLAINASISSDGNKIAIAKAFIEAMIAPEHAVELYRTSGRILDTVSVDTYMTSDLPDIDKTFIKQALLAFHYAKPYPYLEQYQMATDVWKNAILSWYAKEPKRAEDAYAIVQESFLAFTAILNHIEQGK